MNTRKYLRVRVMAYTTESSKELSDISLTNSYSYDVHDTEVNGKYSELHCKGAHAHAIYTRPFAKNLWPGYEARLVYDHYDHYNYYIPFFFPDLG